MVRAPSFNPQTFRDSNMTIASVIKGVSHHVPSRRVTNDDLTALMETTNDWIVERTGIRERRFIEDPSVSTSDLAAKAIQNTLAKAGWEIKEVDYLIAATLSPDFYFPGIGTILQNKLGFRNIPALDIRVQCSGLVYGMSCADAFIRSGQAEKVILVCAEVQSPVLDLTTRGREMAVLFGDGAGALAIEAVSSERPTVANGKPGIIDSYLGSDGSGAEVLAMKCPGTATPGFISASDIESAKVHPQMEGRVVFKNAVLRMLETAKTLLERNGANGSDLSLVVPHQANLRISEAVREYLGLPPERIFNNIQRYGNTTAATIPICLSEAAESGVLKPGDLVLTLAFGAGFTWGGNLIRW